MSNLNDNFWKWFGNSKMVNSDGTPKIFYHVTASDFNEFKPVIWDKKLKNFIPNDEGRQQYYFTQHKDWVDNFAKNDFNRKQKQNKKVLEVYLKVENPLICTTIKEHSLDWWLEYFKKHNINFSREELNKISRYGGEGYLSDTQYVAWEVIFRDTNLIATKLKESGYDGFIVSDTKRTNKNIASVIVFDSNQIKSVDNNGNWSNSNNIYEDIHNFNIENINFDDIDLDWDDLGIDDKEDENKLEIEYDPTEHWVVVDKNSINDNFAKWWGNSQCCNSKGEPIIVYHSTNAEFDAFKTNLDGTANGRPVYGGGFCFSAYENYTKEFGKNTMPCVLSIQKPLDLSKNPKLDLMTTYKLMYKDSWRKYYYDIDHVSRGYLQDKSENVISCFQLLNNEGYSFEEIMNAYGYDGIIDGHIFVVVRPNQIKSINNKGTWSKNSNNIYEGIEEVVLNNNYTQIGYNPTSSELEGMLNKYKALRMVIATETLSNGTDRDILVCMPAAMGDHGLLNEWLINQGIDIDISTCYHIVKNGAESFLTLDSFYKNDENLSDLLLDEFKTYYSDSEKIYASFFKIKKILPNIINTDYVEKAVVGFYQQKIESVEQAMTVKQLIEKLKQVIINPKEEDFWDEMEDETGMNKVSENVVSMFDYKYKQEDLMEKFIRKYLKNDDYYTLYKVAKMLSSMNKSYLEKNLNVKLSDKEYNELKDDLKDLVRLGDEALNEEVSSAQLGTAPTPSLGQVTVNGKPWTSGKSYKAKRKKKIKETSDSTLFSIEYKNEKNEHKTIRVNIEQLNQIIKYPSTITIDNFYSKIDTLLTNPNLFESPSDFRGDVVMFVYSNYNDINTEDVVEAISFFNTVASESDPIFDDPEKSYNFWVYTEGKTRQFYKYPSIREYQERQPVQFSFYYHILYNAQYNGHLMMSAIKKAYPEIHDRIEREREEERLRKEKEQKERDKKDIQYQNAMKEFKKIKTASDFCKFLSKYEGKAYIEGYVNAYTSSDNQELVTATRITVSYINNEWNIATTNYIREYGRIGTNSFDNTTKDHVWRIVKGAWIGEYANEGTKFEIYSLGRVFRNTIGSIKENYTTLNKLKNIIKMAESLNEQEVYGTISEQVAEWLDKLSFKNVDTKEGIVYKKEGNYKHLVKYNNQDDIIEYRITKDGNIIYNNKWTISSPEQVSVIFKEINKEYEGHE